MKKFQNFKAVFSIVILLILSSCVETVIVGSVATSVVATREKSVSDTKNDSIIAAKLGTTFLANGLKNPGNSIDITVDEGRVLLTGIARNPEKAKMAQEFAWKIEGVNEVIDEIQIDQDQKINFSDFTSASRDYLITAEIEARMLVNRDIKSFNYHVSTVAKTVYLFGLSQNKKEMDLAIAIASRVGGVQKVVNHLILVNDSRRDG